MASENYGSKFWRVEWQDGSNMYIMADSLTVSNSGDLLAWGGFRKSGDSEPKEKQLLLGAASGEWCCFYAASVMDGTAVCLDSKGHEDE